MINYLLILFGALTITAVFLEYGGILKDKAEALVLQVLLGGITLALFFLKHVLEIREWLQ